MPQKSPDRESIAQFYDGHATNVQQRVGVNLRHRSVLRRLVRAGFRPGHRVLEIGCGIGTLTGLMAKRLGAGTILAVDISEGAVQLARARFAGDGRVTFMVSDMTTFAVDARFDLIVLPDVLEHIPEENHDGLCDILQRHLAPSGRVCIHIPDPCAQEWLRIERPDALQIIDQSLAIGPMVERFARHGMLLDRYERYSLWTRESDYDWIEFRRAPDRIGQTRFSYVRRVFNELRSRLPW